MVGLLEGAIVQSWAETHLRYSTDDHLRAFVQARKPIPIGTQCIAHLASKHDIRDLVGAELLLVGQWERGIVSRRRRDRRCENHCLAK